MCVQVTEKGCGCAHGYFGGSFATFSGLKQCSEVVCKYIFYIRQRALSSYIVQSHVHK